MHGISDQQSQATFRAHLPLICDGIPAMGAAQWPVAGLPLYPG